MVNYRPCNAVLKVQILLEALIDPSSGEQECLQNFLSQFDSERICFHANHRLQGRIRSALAVTICDDTGRDVIGGITL